MARKKSQPSFGPNQAYIVSFGDMMTALLAFFIVLCSLAEEQTGANLHAGTGSFVRALDGFGLPGAFSKDTSSRAVSLSHAGPLYVVSEPGQEPDKESKGPDETDNGLRVIDREQEEMQRFVNEMNRLAQVKKLPTNQGEVSFDFFNALSTSEPLLPKSFDSVMVQLVPLLNNPAYRIDLVVWATTPSRSAWTRAARQAARITREIEAKAGHSTGQQTGLRGVGKPWLYSDVKRPVFSIVVRRVSTVGCPD